jgi:predicted TIM-barrel fold metal-dependent hydrolase
LKFVPALNDAIVTMEIIDPHVHIWDPRKTPREVTPVVRLFGRWPNFAEALVRKATPQPLIDFVGDPQYVMSAHMPETFHADTGHHTVAGYVHIEADWKQKGTLGPVGETLWLESLADPPMALVAKADLSDPAVLEAQLDAHALSSGRLRGIRDIVASHPSESVHTWCSPDNRLATDEFRTGLATLGERQLSFDLWCYSNQLEEAASVASDVPQTRIVLDHMGTPVDVAKNPGMIDDWYEGLAAVAENRNVWLKLSGLLMPIVGFGYHERDTPPSHLELVDAMAPHIAKGIELFGVDRCMFASNFPMDKVSSSYSAIFDAYLAIADGLGLGAEAKEKLFAGTASSFYRLGA